MGICKEFCDRTGFNIILVEREKDLYGDWYILITTNTPGMREQRYPEPFALNYGELEERIKNMRVIDIYQTEVKVFDINYFIKFIERAF